MKQATLKLYLSGLSCFLLALTFASITRDDPGFFMLPILATVVAAASTLGIYLVAERAMPRNRDLNPALGGYEFLFWAALGISTFAAGLFLTLAETSPLLEVFRRAIDKSYVPSHTDLEIRLVTALMPHWAEAVFEASRRFVLPICGVLIVLGRVPRSPIRVIVVAILCLFFVLSTADRAIPVLFAAVFYGARFLAGGINPFKDKWFYIAVVVAVIAIAGLKPIQYGEYRGVDVAQNPEIAEMFTKEPAAGSGSQGPAKAHNDVSILSVASYVALSTVERIVLSPATMLTYSFKNYDSSNFQHWSTTRVFSLLGVGRYIDPLEPVAGQQHHEAFPVTFLGDLWRQGGLIYIPFYCAALGVLLWWLDRKFFVGNDGVWRPFVLLGIGYLFYGNAFTATSILLIGGSVLGHYFTRLIGRLHKGEQGDPAATHASI